MWALMAFTGTLLLLAVLAVLLVVGFRRAPPPPPQRDGYSSPTAFPRRLFQTWKSRTVIPERLRRWSESWKRQNPEYAYELWDDADNRAFIQRYYPWFLPRYDAYPREILRADAVRYFYLYHHGGIYVDMDFECLQPLESLLIGSEGSYDVILGRLSVASENDIPNAIMISKPREEFWLTVIHHLTRHDVHGHTESITGPILLKKALAEYQENPRPSWWDNLCRRMRHTAEHPSRRTRLWITPPRVFYPIDWQVPGSNDIGPDTLAVTYWMHSW